MGQYDKCRQALRKNLSGLTFLLFCAIGPVRAFAECSLPAIPGYQAGVYSLKDAEWYAARRAWDKALFILARMPQTPLKGLSIRKTADAYFEEMPAPGKEEQLAKAECVLQASRTIPSGAVGRDAALPVLIGVYLNWGDGNRAAGLLPEIERLEVKYVALSALTAWEMKKGKTAAAKTHALQSLAIVESNPDLFRSESSLYDLLRTLERLGEKKSAARLVKKIEADRKNWPNPGQRSVSLPDPAGRDENEMMRDFLSAATGYRLFDSGKSISAETLSEAEMEKWVLAALRIEDPEGRTASLNYLLDKALKSALQAQGQWFRRLLSSCRERQDSPFGQACLSKAGQLLARALEFEQAAQLLGEIKDPKLRLRLGAELVSVSFQHGAEASYLPLVEPILGELAASPEVPSKWESEKDLSLALASIGQKEFALRVASTISDDRMRASLIREAEDTAPLLRLQTPVPAAAEAQEP